MKIRIEGKNVDVLDELCAKRSCFSLGADKGAFIQGRGYVTYWKEMRWCCMTRHLHGCPSAGICPECRTRHAELLTKCSRCGADLEAITRTLEEIQP